MNNTFILNNLQQKRIKSDQKSQFNYHICINRRLDPLNLPRKDGSRMQELRLTGE